VTNTSLELFSLAGPTAVVTGGSRGLGRAIALAFADAGADVVLVSRTLQDCLAVADEVRDRGRQALAILAHAGHWDELQAVIDAAYERFGRLDVLVNNAGSSPQYESLSNVTESLFDSVLNLNLKGPFRLSVLAADRMRSAGGGSIVNISSLAASRPEPLALPYAAAKMGLDVVTIGLALEYGPTVRVNSIRPGSFATSVSAHWSEDIARAYADRVIMKRVAQPEEIVGAALYLASRASSFVTGRSLEVDGGPR
jgi:NAD(P)-dependent dehydrogenase (short-subunit alcohol dehydrogenase family)